MDPVINSLVQSPLVRSLSTVPSKSASFVHGVRDNVPPFAFEKVVVQPFNSPSTTSQDSTHKFRIPQFGTLNRAYLRIKTFNEIPKTRTDWSVADADYATLGFARGASGTPIASANYDVFKAKTRLPWLHASQQQMDPNENIPFGGGGSTIVDRNSTVSPEDNLVENFGSEAIDFASDLRLAEPGSKMGGASNAWNVVNVLSDIKLSTNGKTIETIYGETIPAEVVKMPQQLRDFYISGMVGWAMGDADGIPLDEPSYEVAWDPSACMRDKYGRFMTAAALNGEVSTVRVNSQHVNFIVPVTLSSLKSLPKNYQTRFVEDLELEVKMKPLARGFNEVDVAKTLSKVIRHEVELVLIYHNWHDNIENTIRNSNFKRGVPASIYSTNWVRAAATSSAISDTNELSIPIKARNLVTELVIVARGKKNGGLFNDIPALASRKSDYTINQNCQFSYKVELTGSGKTIWSSTNKELQGPDSADYDLVERKISGGDCGYGGNASSRRSMVKVCGQKTPLKTSGAADPLYTYSSSDYTHGGVDYSFGDNMAIMRFGFQTSDEFYTGGIALQTISNPTLKITPLNASWVEYGVEFDVYAKFGNIVRIDSDTGAVSRTLDV